MSLHLFKEDWMIVIGRQHRAYAKQVIEFAKKIGMYGTGNVSDLRRNLIYLRDYADHEHKGLTQCELYRDEPWGFGFVMRRRNDRGEYRFWFNGGLLYHGSHDGFGSGSGPTFAVTVLPTDGWSIHT
jgi:hypothetical protein